MVVDTKVTNLILNVLTEDEYAAAAKNENELYLVEDAVDIEAVVAEHIANKGNPHGVTAAQIGAALADHTHDTDPFEEKFVEIIPVDLSNLTEFPDVEGGYGYNWIELPEPLYLDKYKYKLTLSVWGMQKQGKESGATPTCMDVELVPNTDPADDDVIVDFGGLGCTEEPTDVDKLGFPRLREYTAYTVFSGGSYRVFLCRCGYAHGELLPVMSDQRLSAETAYDTTKPLKYIRWHIYNVESAVTATSTQTYGVALSYRAIAEV